MNGVRRCWFSGTSLAEPFMEGIVDVPLAQTGEGIAECELLKWYVQEVSKTNEPTFAFHISPALWKEHWLFHLQE